MEKRTVNSILRWFFVPISVWINGRGGSVLKNKTNFVLEIVYIINYK